MPINEQSRSKQILRKVLFSNTESGRKRKYEKKYFISKEMETVIKKHPNNKCPEPGGFIEKFYHLENT